MQQSAASLFPVDLFLSSLLWGVDALSSTWSTPGGSFPFPSFVCCLRVGFLLPSVILVKYENWGAMSTPSLCCGGVPSFVLVLFAFWSRNLPSLGRLERRDFPSILGGECCLSLYFRRSDQFSYLLICSTGLSLESSSSYFS